MNNTQIRRSNPRASLALALLTACAFSGSHAIAQTTNFAPNGDFETPGPTPDWVETQGGGFTYSYPTTGGNPGGYGVIDGTATTQWAIWVNGDSPPLTLGSLGLTAGNPYTFKQDMKVFSSAPGTNVGGFKIDFFNDVGMVGSTGDMRPSVAGHNIGAWETYDFPVTIPLNALYLKLVPLWGPSSIVGYDNVRVIIPATIPLTASITTPLNASTVGTNFTINAQSSVTPGAVTNVYFYDGASLVGSDDTAPYSVAVTGAALGAHALKVVAKADTGASITSSVVNVTVATAVTVTVDPAKTWAGYLNAFDRPQDGGAFKFGSAWGTADLRATFSGSTLTLSPNTIGDSSDYWYVTTNSPSVGNKFTEANMYVEPAGSLPGMAVTFTGKVISDTLTSLANTNPAGNGWTCVAFIKDLAPDYSSSIIVTIPVTNGALFSLTSDTIADPARHIQYGFQTVGPCVWATDPVLASYGNVQVGPPVSVPTTPTLTNPLIVGGNFTAQSASQSGFNYILQGTTSFTPASWVNLSTNAGTGSTLNYSAPVAPGSVQRFYRIQVQ